jgi:ribosomal protein S18 acetylase RimI-like enzyme
MTPDQTESYRPWTPSDRDRCLAVFDSNLPRYFAPADRVPFVEFLARPVGFFGVLTDGDALIGCGGIAPVDAAGQVAVLTWGMIDAGRHRQGWGRRLTWARLRRLMELPAVLAVALKTSHETIGFYEKLGFRTTKFTPHGYRPGLHRHDMELPVDAAFRRRLALE